MLILFGLCVGMLIGIFIETLLNNKIIKAYKNETEKMMKLLESQSEIIEVYANCYNDLEKAYNNCQEGVSATINENIKLRRRLNYE